MSDVKLCIECKHCHRDPDSYTRLECWVANEPHGFSLVTGEATDCHDPIGCNVQRSSNGKNYCGPSAKFYEPKETT